ncbi:MAG: hypothetical protein EDX89_09525 [Acidobacteria bacterium]|nr:MAG: hypothetical protein EDX89_09525 [Acidobacteriota bacterium]
MSSASGTRARACRAIAARRSGSRRSDRIAAASAAGLPAGTATAASGAQSATQPTGVPTVGTPEAAASRTATGAASWRDGRTWRSARERMPATAPSSTGPWKETNGSTPSLAARRAASPPVVSAPAASRTASRPAARSRASDSRSVPGSFTGDRLARLART